MVFSLRKVITHQKTTWNGNSKYLSCFARFISILKFDWALGAWFRVRTTCITMWKTEIGGIKNTRSDCHRKWVDKSSTNQNCVRTEVMSQQTITKNTFLNSLYYLPKLSWKWNLIRSICMWMCARTIRIALSNYFDVFLTYEILMQVNLFTNLYQSKLIFF